MNAMAPFVPFNCNRSPIQARPKSRVKADEAYIAILEFLTEYSRTPGRHISDRVLSLRLNISRTPVREALIRLAAEGQILSIPQKGYFSRPQSEKQLLDLYELVETLLEPTLFRVKENTGEGVPSSMLLDDAPSVSEPAADTECIFMAVAKLSGNEELVAIIGRFNLITHLVRAEMAAHKAHRNAFQKSLISMREAMRGDLGKLGSALAGHIGLERRLVPQFAREINARAVMAGPFASSQG